MKPSGSVAGALLVLVVLSVVGAGRVTSRSGVAGQAAAAQAATPSADALDGLLAPVALYPDQLLAQMLESAKIPARVQEFSGWLVRNDGLTGTGLQDAARQQGFEPSLVLLALFPKVVNFMADNIAWTRELGTAFSSNREAVFDSIQRLRANSLKAGTLKTTPQQSVQLKTAQDGKQVIVIEPANPQVVYVPQYNPQVVYTNPPTSTTTVVVKEDNSTEAAVVGAVVGFTAGIAIGAAMNNNYYYGPYGWHGGPAMYNDAWNDWYDDREDAREDWYDNREDAREDIADNRQDLASERSERAGNAQEQRTERAENRQGTRTDSQAQRSGSTASANAQARGSGSSATTQARSTGSASVESRGSTRGEAGTSPERSGTRSDAFSGYSSGKSERASSERGKSSRSRSSSGGGGRSKRR
jgi:Protein of unknown function (DUF3300)